MSKHAEVSNQIQRNPTKSTPVSLFKNYLFVGKRVENNAYHHQSLPPGGQTPPKSTPLPSMASSLLTAPLCRGEKGEEVSNLMALFTFHPRLSRRKTH